MKPFIIILIVLALGVLGWYLLSASVFYGLPEEDVNLEEGLGAVEDGPISVEPTLVYAGTLPAASSPGIETELTLTDRGDGQGGGFMLVETYIDETDGTFEYTGQWELQTGVIEADPAAEVYVLTSEEDPDFETRYYELIDEDTV